MSLNLNRWMQRVSLLGLLSLILFQFQNCAQPEGSAEFSSDSEVRLVDGWVDSSKLAFMSPTYLVQNEISDIEVHGVCPLNELASDPNQVDWQLIRLSDGAVMLNGQSNCFNGGFHLQVSDVDFSGCSTRYEIRAQSVLSSSQKAVTTLKSFCDTQI